MEQERREGCRGEERGAVRVWNGGGKVMSVSDRKKNIFRIA